MIRRLIFLFFLSCIPISAISSNCEFIMNEIDQFRYFSPSAKVMYKNQIQECGIEKINEVLVNDYFNIESDVLLS